MDLEKSNNKSIKEKFALSEERFRMLFKHIPAAVAMFDKDMRYLAVSEHWLERYNISNEDVIGKSHYKIFPDISGKWVAIYQICLSGMAKQGKDTIVTRDGTEEWIEWQIHPWYESSGDVGGIIIYADLIKDRKNTDMELIKAREKAEEVSRAKSVFIANMSHEFRTPLNAILGYSEIMKHSGELSEEQRNFVDEITRGGKQLLSMINNIIDLSKIETSNMEYREVTFPPEQLIRGAVDGYLTSFRKKGITLAASISKGVPKTLSTDFKKLDRILQQLISNALKFTDSGAVNISVGFERAEHSDAGANSTLTLLVSGSGIGISEEKINLVFKPSLKIDSDKSTDLGLTLVKRLVRFLGGQIEVKSEAGKGFSFEVIIPAKASDTFYDKDKELWFVDEASLRNDATSAEDVFNFIESLTEENKKIIKEAIELQDLEKISKLEQYLNISSEPTNSALEKLKKSAENFNFKFLNEMRQLVK